ncbi:hypothetical protein GAO09_16550 [Rhizobiales bacterium RZME27]|uniref:Uncharacterized protein n=1 Tax=Endobacterium cereale TaxID=2663029 RepID=A0A6A8ACL3_9HYPH|nr:hypothetical protein [Endobacterium cereale]MEB2846935.1 hypothetical protein [Endobacterium cereale]MQY47647.1 hypothetical protein [Endobacterium cereale]
MSLLKQTMACAGVTPVAPFSFQASTPDIRGRSTFAQKVTKTDLFEIFRDRQRKTQPLTYLIFDQQN